MIGMLKKNSLSYGIELIAIPQYFNYFKHADETTFNLIKREVGFQTLFEDIIYT